MATVVAIISREHTHVGIFW